MALKKTGRLVTVGGLLSTLGTGFVGIPLLVITAYAQVIKDGPPAWFIPWIFPMMLFGFVLLAVGHSISGIAGAGEDDVPTAPQVNAATQEAAAVKQVEAAKVDPAAGGKP